MALGGSALCLGWLCLCFSFLSKMLRGHTHILLITGLPKGPMQSNELHYKGVEEAARLEDESGQVVYASSLCHPGWALSK